MPNQYRRVYEDFEGLGDNSASVFFTMAAKSSQGEYEAISEILQSLQQQANTFFKGM